MTTIYLVRHAEAEGNLYRIAQGQDNSNLTDRGWRQVRALERRFADLHIDAVYASDLYRTCATASSVYKPKGLPLHRSQALREICVGAWEQRPWGEIYRRWPEEMAHFSTRPDLWQMEDAEDPRDALARVLKEVRTIAKAHDGQTVAVFSHGYVLRMLLSHLQGYELSQLGETPTGDNTAVSLLEAEGENLQVVFRDDTSHLRTPEFLAEETGRKRATGLEAGLWFAPLSLPDQAETACALAAASWPEELPFDRDRLLAGSAGIRMAYLGEEPVGLLRVEPERGWISLLCIRPDCRGRGLGVQLIGQAAMSTRACGGTALSAALPASAPVRAFLEDYGFHSAGDGTMRKEIGFLPEFLGD